jgi:glycosyltransferase involved in cell wall biosynthesis
VKTYGIYLAYPPRLSLEAQGLGRHLVAFLDQARNRKEVRFVIACPSWMRAPFFKLLHDSGIPSKTFEIIGPEAKPLLLSSYEAVLKYRSRRRRKGLLFRLAVAARAFQQRAIARLERITVTSRNPLVFATIVVLAGLGILAAASVYLVIRPVMLLLRAFSETFSKVRRKVSGITGPILRVPQSSEAIVGLYRLMEEAEAEILLDQINQRKDILAWYCPTAFWPHFNLINAPRLACVPDVVLSDFPVAFAAINGDRLLEVFKSVETTINGGDNFVTYSEQTKKRTLIDGYHVSPNAITVVPHGANRLEKLIFVSGFPDNEAATVALCQNLVRRALNKASDILNAANVNVDDAKFIFYASQFRPNKNLISLLRAYEFLLRRRFVGRKLILTGNPDTLPEVANFISEHNLQGDVICLHGLSERELAACYRLADLAVNPSLSEGGCPFTLTEALSVGTPVVMARIAVTEEVVTDFDLQKLMLFDPYDWEDMAERIEWALENRDVLLRRQLELYEKLSQRSWETVVGEYIAILDRISSPTPRMRKNS